MFVERNDRKFSHDQNELNNPNSTTRNYESDIKLNQSPMLFDRNNYSFERTLGKGGFGEVHLVRSNDNLFALKTIPKHSRLSIRESAMREYLAGQKLKHENVVELFDFFETEEHFNLVLEYIDGYDLHTLFERRHFKPISEKIAKRIAYQLIRALDYCHQKGVAHRDVKLQNIMVNRKGKIKLLDFGLCHFIDFDSFSLDGEMCSDPVGSKGYVAPEIVPGIRYSSIAADAWSSGVVIFALLCAKMPFGSSSLKSLRMGHLVPLPWGEKLISEEAIEFVTLLLDPSPYRRLSLRHALSHPWLQDVDWPSESH